MATRNSSGVERRRVPLDANRPRTHPKHSGRKATKVPPPPAEGGERLTDGDGLQRLSRASTGWPTTDAHDDGQDMRRGGAL
jgi:hypothetical protein